MHNEHVVKYYECLAEQYGMKTLGGVSMYRLATQERMRLFLWEEFGYLENPNILQDIPF